MNERVCRFSPDDPARSADWNAYVRTMDSSAGYGLMEWLRIIRDAFGHEPHALAVLRDNKVCGVLPLVLVSGPLFGRFLVSLPFVNYGGVLADDPDACAALLDQAAQLRGRLRARHVELRYAHCRHHDLPVRTDKVSMVLDLPADADTLWKGFKDKVRNQVRKAGKCGLAAEQGGLELLDEFYAVFRVNMRDLGTPVYGKILFETVLRALPQATRVIVVRENGVCIAAGITYAYGDTVQMPWASSLVARRETCPNHLLYWEAIRTACEAGFSLFDFGRSSPDSGPWRFKKQWGVREVPLFWEYLLEDGQSLPELNVHNPRFALAIQAWKHLPLCVANTLGPRIVRCIP